MVSASSLAVTMEHTFTVAKKKMGDTVYISPRPTMLPPSNPSPPSKSKPLREGLSKEQNY